MRVDRVEVEPAGDQDAEGLEGGLTCEPASASLIQWRAFMNKNKLASMELRDVVSAIRERALRLGIPHQ